MSYCRWSSMNWRCDVYVYADVGGGWTTHVAGRRRLVPPIPDMPLMHFPSLGGQWLREERRMSYPSRWHAVAAWLIFGFAAFWHNRVHMASLRLIPLRPIGKAHDGESFNDDTPTACAERLEQLRAVGYVVPQEAIDALRSEVVEDYETPNAEVTGAAGLPDGSG